MTLFVIILILNNEKNNLQGYRYVKSKLILNLKSSFNEFVVEIIGSNKQKWRNEVINPFF